jgi:hypothetical protein
MIDKKVISGFLSDIFENSLHQKRLQSLGNAVQGSIHNCSLAIHAIGSGLAQAQGLNRKHAIKQVDRLLSNDAINIEMLSIDWINYIIGDKREIVISMDWTDFDSDNHATLVMSLQSSHSRSTPLLWKTYNKMAIKGHRHEYENQLLDLLKNALDDNIHVTIVADRGFCDIMRFEHITKLNFNYIIRIKSNIYINNGKGKSKLAMEYLPKNTTTKTIKNAYVTKNEYPVERVVITQKKGMKEAWIIASSCKEMPSSKILLLYAKRWQIETSFRDIKDYRFGMGMSFMHTKDVKKRDRLFLISAISIVLLTLLGKAGEDIGLERTIKANTVKTRSYSLWNQGCIYYSLIPTMKDGNLIPLIEKFNHYLNNFTLFKRMLSII